MNFPMPPPAASSLCRAAPSRIRLAASRTGPPQGNTVSEPQHPRKKRAEHRGLHNAPADPVVSVFHRFFHGEKSEQPRKTGRQHHSRHRKNLIPRSRLRRCTDPDKTGDSQTAQKHERIKRLPFLRSFAVTDADRPPAYPRQQSEKQSPIKKILHLHAPVKIILPDFTIRGSYKFAISSSISIL